MRPVALLLVDDEAGFVDTMIKRLLKRGLSAEGACSGVDALKRLGGGRPVDVVLLDVKMPGMDGIEVLREIRREHPLVEVIMLTGHGTIQGGVEGMKLGAYDYLTKPADIDELVEKVEAACRKKRDHERKIAEARARDIANRRGD